MRREATDKKRTKRIVFIFEILCICFFVAGALVFAYPFIRNYINGRHTEEMIVEYHAVIESQEQDEIDDQPDNIDLPVNSAQSRIFPELWIEMQEYNNRLVTRGQGSMRDVLSYEGFGVDIAPYDLPDNVFGFVDIPALNRTYPLYLGSSRNNMAKGATVLGESSAPIGGESTHCVIAAHSSWAGTEQFLKIHTLKKGNLVVITNPWDTLTYRVIEHKQIKADEFDHLVIQKGKDLLTLFTCYPNGESRWCVLCERMP